MPKFKAEELKVEDQYKLMSGSIIPRPIALVSTLGPDGYNAAPFSFFNCIGVSPPMFMISCSPRDGLMGSKKKNNVKDTVANLRHCPEMVVHIVDYDLRNRMNVCAHDVDSSVDEIEEAGFTMQESEVVKPPRLAECRVQFESKLLDIHEMGKLPYYLILGEVVYFHISDSVINDELHIDPNSLDALGRLAGSGGYTRILDNFVMQRFHPPGSSPPENIFEDAKAAAKLDRKLKI